MTTAKISGTILQVSEDWYAWFFERAPEELRVSTEIESISANGTAIESVDGLELSSEFGNIFAQVNSLNVITGQELTSEISELNANGQSIINIDGQDLNSNIEEISSSGSALNNITGQSLTSEISEVVVITDQSVNVILTGISLSSSLGNVTASATGGETQMVPGNISYQLPKLSAITRINGLEARSEIANLLASGTIIINNRAKIYSIEAKLEAQKVGADGILDINEDELLLLLAA